MTQTQALPTQTSSCPPGALSQSLVWPPSLGKVLASLQGGKRQGLVSSVPKTSGAQSGEAKQPLRHRMPEPKGREGKEPQKSWK